MPRYESGVEIRCQHEAPFDVAYTNNGMVEVVRYSDWKKSQHALWMARAMWASAVCEYYSILANFDNLFSEEEMQWTKWSWVYHKCREKAKEET